VEQLGSIEDARSREGEIIKRELPKYNEQGKWAEA
jgi:hypothetical protein